MMQKNNIPSRGNTEGFAQTPCESSRYGDPSADRATTHVCILFSPPPKRNSFVFIRIAGRGPLYQWYTP